MRFYQLSWSRMLQYQTAEVIVSLTAEIQAAGQTF